MEVVVPHPPVTPSSTTTTTTTATATHNNRREDTTEEYPIAEEALDDANEDNNSASANDDDNMATGVTNTNTPTGGGGGVSTPVTVKQEDEVKRAQNGVRRKKRKKKRREKPIPLPSVGEGETLVPIHTVWSRGRRMKGGHVIKVDDKVVRYIDSKGVVYNLEDTIYLDTKQTDQPFYICSILGFHLKKRDTLSLVVKWFFRVGELPPAVRDHLLQDRHHEHGAYRAPQALSQSLSLCVPVLSGLSFIFI